MIEHIRNSLQEAQRALEAFLANEQTLSNIQKAAELLDVSAGDILICSTGLIGTGDETFRAKVLTGTEQAIAASEAVFGKGDLGALDEQTLAAVIGELPSATVGAEDRALIDLLVATGLSTTRSDNASTASGGSSRSGPWTTSIAKPCTADQAGTSACRRRSGGRLPSTTIWSRASDSSWYGVRPLSP